MGEEEDARAAYPVEDDFHLRLYRAFHAQRKFLQAGHRETGLGSGQPKLLAYIDRHPACTQRELSTYYDLDAAGVCRMLDGLERAGFIASAPDPADRRAKHLRITPAGARSLAIWRAHCDQLEHQLLKGFSAAERAAFAGFLERAYLNLRGRAPHAVEGGDPSTSGLRPSAQDDKKERAFRPSAQDDREGRAASCHPERSAGEARAESKDPQPRQPHAHALQSEARHA